MGTTGQNANRSGREAENILAAVMRGLGFEFSRQRVVGQTIYGTRLRVDFVVHNLAMFPSNLIIESKWQDVGGSIDEKFPYLVENIKRQHPFPTIVVVYGGGCRDGAVEWLRDHVDGQQFVDVFTLERFVSWAMRAEKVSLTEA